MAPGPIVDLVQTIIDTPMDSIASPYIHALLIARHGKLVVEEYFHGYTAGMPHETRSASKSVTSTLIGLALHDGAPLEVSTPVYDLMYDGNPPDKLDPRAGRMTLEHLLTMTPGLACDDNESDSPGQEETMQSQSEQPDWAQYTLDLPMAHEPGEHAAYCSASPNLALAMLRNATDTWIPELYQRLFAEPLQTGRYHMNLMPNGEAYGGGGQYIKARDFLKMGQVFLDDGSWKGERVLSDEWVHHAIMPKSHMFDQGYGYLWWILDYPYKDRTVQAFYAGGNGGQYVIGIPELDVVVVFFGGNYSQSVLHKPKRVYVPNYIIKSIEQGEE
jgi:CubicO group peptidase (beta-lactamase class C family)